MGRPEGEEEGGDFFVDLKDRAVSPTEEGVDKMEGLLGVPNLYDADPRLARHFEQALRAHALYKRDKDYIVKDGEIIIVDEFTGRQMPGRRWSEGLHQAIEAKEGLRVQRESVTLATITFQNYFRLYDKLAGMTGTAMTEAEEFHKIYNLEVVAVPTHRDMIRDDEADLVFRNEPSKFNALIDEIVEMHEVGRPVLVGTISVEKSEVLATLLKRRGIKHEVLNAKFHEKESGIVAQAGRSGAITIATNMAGRGTDIQLGGNPAGLASEILHKRGMNPAEVDKATYDEALAGQGDLRRGPRPGGRRRRAAHHRHRAARLPADRQPAPRPGRPAGRPGVVALLPVARRRPDEALRLRPGRRADGADGPRGRRRDRVAAGEQDDRERPEPGRGLQLRHPQAGRRVTTTSSTSSARRSTPSATRSSTTRTSARPSGFLDEELDALLGQFAGGETADEWNIEGLAAALKAMGLEGPGTSEDDLWEVGGREALRQPLGGLVDKRLDEKEQEVGEADWTTIERLVLLRTIDSLWVEHLTELDDMRRGIGLRGYAQQDPLNEFRREAFPLYTELRDLIRHQLANTIFRVTVNREPAPPPPTALVPRCPTRPRSRRSAPATAPRTGAATRSGAVRNPASSAVRALPSGPVVRGVRESLGDTVLGGGGAAMGAGALRPGYAPDGRRMGRNDICFCGSGLKYKKCHGR